MCPFIWANKCTISTQLSKLGYAGSNLDNCFAFENVLLWSEYAAWNKQVCPPSNQFKKMDLPDGTAEWVEYPSPVLVDHEIIPYGRVKPMT